MTAPHQDVRVESVIRAGAESLAEAATAALPGVLRTFVRPYRARLATALERGVRELLATVGLVTGKVAVTVAPGAPITVRLRD